MLRHISKKRKQIIDLYPGLLHHCIGPAFLHRMQSEIKLTEDGSSTLYVLEIDETYHSTHGAIQESMHIFIGQGLNMMQKESIRILEVGFGTGLNALLTALHTDKQIEYITIEKYPIDKQFVQILNYPEHTKISESRSVFEKIHQSPWEKLIEITPHFRMQKVKTNFCDFAPSGKFDLIYFDAFSPEKQPEMWELKQFEKLFNACHPGAVIVTYCAKGAVRRNMQSAGFTVERLPGPPGKREILRGNVEPNI